MGVAKGDVGRNEKVVVMNGWFIVVSSGAEPSIFIMHLSERAQAITLRHLIPPMTRYLGYL